MSYLPTITTVFGSSGVLPNQSFGSILAEAVGSTVGTVLGGRSGSTTLPWYQQGDIEGVAPSIWLDFSNNRYAVNGVETALSSISTFSRASSVIYMGSNGLLQTGAIDTPVFGYNPLATQNLGMLIEGLGTNKLVYSHDATQAYWVKDNGAVTATGTAPDGGTANLYTSDTATNPHRVKRTAPSVTGGVKYTVSGFFKYNGYDLTTVIFTTTTTASARFVLSNGTVTATSGAEFVRADITPYPNGWYRCSITFTPAATASNYQILLQATNGASTNFTGDGVRGFYLWGLQLEDTPFPTSLIYTNGASASRSAGLLQVNDTGFINATAGTLYAKYTAPFMGLATFRRPVSLNDKTGGNGNVIGLAVQDSSTDQYYAQVGTSGENVYVSANSSYTENLTAKHAISYNASAQNNAYNGTLASGSGAAITLPSLNNLTVAGFYSSQHLFGFVSEVRYYPAKLTNASIQTLTT